jgi:hypothetical protein
VGWLGVVAILLAYALVSLDVISTHSLAYPLLNVFGAIFLIVETGYKKDAQPMVLNVVWLGVAVVAFLRLL